MEIKDKQISHSKIMLSLASFIVVIAGVMAAEAIITPILLSLFISIICIQPIIWLNKKGVNHTLAVILVLVGIIAIFIGFGAVVGNSINDFASNAPFYANKLRGLLDGLIMSLNERGIKISAEKWESIIDPGSVMNYTANVLSDFGAFMSNALLIFFIVLFILLERASIRLKAEIIAGSYQNDLDVPLTIIESIRSYLGLKTMISMATGFFIWIWLLIFGVDYALLWGLLAFLLNYIPNIGSIIAGIPAVLFALVQIGPAGAGWTMLGYGIVNMIVGNLVEPRVMGKKMQISTLIVFLSLVFWGFVLGTIGMFLAVPLTMMFKIIFDENPRTAWISVLLGSDKHALEVAEENKQKKKLEKKT